MPSQIRTQVQFIKKKEKEEKKKEKKRKERERKEKKRKKTGLSLHAQVSTFVAVVVLPRYSFV